MRDLHLICVGKLKDQNYLQIENEYTKRLTLFDFKIHEVKPSSEQLDLEAADVLKKVQEIAKDGKAYLILMAEKGKKRDSQGFSDWLFNLIENRKEKIIFIIGGAAGHGKAVLEAANESISLSDLTFPHQMARAILSEQLYRAQTIFQGHPYHK